MIYTIERTKSVSNTSPTKTTRYVFHDNCVHWEGYKPCQFIKRGLTKSCLDCHLFEQALLTEGIEQWNREDIILIIEAGGLGSILQTTSVAKQLKKSSPSRRIVWVTHQQGAELLRNVPSVDEIIVYSKEILPHFLRRDYKTVINYESSPEYLRLAHDLTAYSRKGFTL